MAGDAACAPFSEWDSFGGWGHTEDHRDKKRRILVEPDIPAVCVAVLADLSLA